jgi:anti-sigma regulatory factor (Ser/Thr protein kinase)
MPYRGAAELTAGVASVVPAVGGGGAVLVACPETSVAPLRDGLDGLGQRVIWADMRASGRNPARFVGAIREFADQHPGGIAWCVQQLAWPGRSSAELREVIRHEALLNLALAGEPVCVLCPYDVGLGAELVAAAESTHPMAIRDGRWLASSGYAGQPVLPPEFDSPLSPPPADAALLAYHDGLAPVRAHTAERARRAGLPPERVTDLMIAVAELTANTLGHTSGAGVLWIWATDSEIICQVDDAGQNTDPLAGRQRPDSPVNGGHGLWLVNQACDLVELRSGPAGTTVRVHMWLDGSPAA